MNNKKLKSPGIRLSFVLLALFNTGNVLSHGDSNKKTVAYFDEVPSFESTTKMPDIIDKNYLFTIEQSMKSIITLLNENKTSIINHDVSIMMKLHDANLKIENSLERLNYSIDKSNDPKKTSITDFLQDLSLSFTQYRILISQSNIEKSKTEITHANNKLLSLYKHLE